MLLQEKRDLLLCRLKSARRLLVAYSGGVDSAFLAWAAHEALGDRMLAVVADSPSLSRTHLADALAFADQHGIPTEVVTTSEMDRPEYARNDSRRCFFCKDELFTVLEKFRAERGFEHIAYGVNADDTHDYRPGQQAAKAHGVTAPLAEAQLTKQDIRDLARDAGLSVWDRPASACLASRIEYGRPVTIEALNAVEHGEDALRALGFRQFRVRYHGQIARIEIAREELARALTVEMAAEFTRVFKDLGFTYVTLDLEGFRSGSMNAILPKEVLERK